MGRTKGLCFSSVTQKTLSVYFCVCVCAHAAFPGLAVALGTQHLCKIKGIYSIYKHGFTQISLL